MHTSAILSLGSKINTPELLCVIDKDTDIDLLISVLHKMYLDPNSGDKDDKSVFAEINLKETIEYILLAISYKFPEKLEDIIKRLPLRILKDLLDKMYDNEIQSEQLLKIFNLIERECAKRLENINNILPHKVKVIGFDAYTDLFTKSNIHINEYKNDFFDKLFSLENLIGVSTEPLNQLYVSGYLSDIGKFISHLEALNTRVTVSRETLAKYVNLKKYPKIRSRKAITIGMLLIAVKKDNKFYWRLYIYEPKRTNHPTDVETEKQKLGIELQKKFKFQNKEVDLVIGTEEEIIEELKRRFPKEEVK